MPEYLAPGVYVEEVSFRSKSIEGVSTTTTGFVGPTRFGPIDVPPDVVTNLAEFERTYGGGEQLDWDGTRVHNYVWHAARAFFENGGRRLYVQRAFAPLPTDPTVGVSVAADGRAVGWPGRTASETLANESGKTFTVKARFPGAAGNFIVRFAPRAGENVFVAAQGGQPARLNGVQDGDLVAAKVVNPSFLGQIDVSPAVSIGTAATGTLVVTSADNTDTRTVTLYGVVGGNPVAVDVTLVAGTATTTGSAFETLHGVFASAAGPELTVTRGTDVLVDAEAAPVAVKAITGTLQGTTLKLRPGQASNATVLVVGTTTSGAAQLDLVTLNGTNEVASAKSWGSVTRIAAGQASPTVGLAAYPFGAAGAAVVTVTPSGPANVGVTVEGRNGTTAVSEVVTLDSANARSTAASFTAVDRVVVQSGGSPELTIRHGDVVMYRFTPPSPSTPLELRKAVRYYDMATARNSWRFERPGTPTDFVTLDELLAPTEVRHVTVTVDVRAKDGSALGTWGGLGLGALDDFFSERPATLGLQRSLPIVVTSTGALPAAFATAVQSDPTSRQANVEIELFGGNDGVAPSATAAPSGADGSYEGKADPTSTVKTGLKAFEDIEDISIVAAPGATWIDPLATGGALATATQRANTIVSLLVAHAERMRYRIAVVDSVNGHSIADVRAFRARFDSKYAALYYPWVRVLDPVTRKEIVLPPSGFVTGIYARNDTLRAVYKAPANEIVTLALGFEQMLSHAQQEVLNPEGINCMRFFEGRGMRVWGARTLSSDPEWKYVNVRRYFNYLEHSVDRGTQWAVFEPNGPLLWNNVRRTIEDFLVNEFQMGALLGDKPEKAFFVRCDRSTMTQNDLDNGRLVCLIGVAPLKPAEFVIFRIGQWTADAKN
jgi:phage tail sheath protein FI